jgi:hypothetical protein
MIDIVIPYSGRYSFLLRALDSINIQSEFVNKVIVVVDFVERPEIIIDNYNLNLKIINNTKGKGSNQSRNVGFEHTITEYVHFLDDDDKLGPNFYKSFFEFVQSNENIVGIYFDALVVSDQNLNSIIYKVNKKTSVSLLDLLVENYIGTTSSVILKSNYFKIVGGFDSTILTRQDYNLWLRLSEYGNFSKCFGSNIYYTIHNNKDTTSISNSNFKNHLQSINKIDQLKLVMSEKFNLKYDLKKSKINNYSYLLKRTKNFNAAYFFIKIFLLNPFSPNLINFLPTNILNSFKKMIKK